MAQGTIKLDALLYNDSTATNNPSERLFDQEITETITSLDVVDALERDITNAASPVTINLPATTCTYLVIFTDREITINLNALGSITLTPQTAGTRNFVFYHRGTISSLTVSNADAANDANVTFLLAN